MCVLVVTKTAKVSVSGVGLGLDHAGLGLGLGLPGLGLGSACLVWSGFSDSLVLITSLRHSTAYKLLSAYILYRPVFCTGEL